jgi:hypothetical protein
MDDLTLTCRNERRRQAVRDQANTDGGLNGIDYVEVIEGSDQRHLCVHFFGEIPEDLEAVNVRVEGGTRIRGIKVLRVKEHNSPDPEHEDCLRVTLDKAGDFSCYKLCLYEDKEGRPTKILRKDFDPRYVCATFSFKTECPSDLDCKDEKPCPLPARTEPEINYLARDYASFRQLLLDRLALVMPDWRERHVPDIGIALVEVLAYVGDHLSYYQDAVATEAYLDTARRRISVRRHVVPINYRMHEGCNARTWICVDTKMDKLDLTAEDISFVTGCPELTKIEGNVISQDTLDSLIFSPRSYEVFEPVVEDKTKKIPFYRDHSEIHFYTWGNSECCLPRGATRATLSGRLMKHSSAQSAEQTHAEKYETSEEEAEKRIPKLHLKAGDVLIFEEVAGAKTGNPSDADPTRRCAVRLTQVSRGEDPLTDTPVVEIEWAKADALPFELCLSARLNAPNCKLKENISVARGNVLLVDHGKTIKDDEDCGTVPTEETVGECAGEGSALEYTYVPGKFKTKLQRSPLTFCQKASFHSPASMCLAQNPREALPAVALYGKPANTHGDFKPHHPKWRWLPKFDLLSSGPNEQSFVVEMDNEGQAHLRFGDGECGRMPGAGTTFAGVYRTGNGTAGNVGADTITYMVTRTFMDGLSIKPRNPLAAQGGVEAEPISEVKLYAPGMFHKKLQRAITADDYAQLAMNNPKVQRAAARLRWSGSWREARVDIDPYGTEDLSGKLRRESEGLLHRYRRIGHDLRVVHARYVPLDIEIGVCVAPHYERGHVEAAVYDAFSDRVLPNGRRGFFHPDNLTFGNGIYLSALVAAAGAVEGVVAVEVKKLQRLFEGENLEIENGFLPLGSNEVAQVDNDPNFPERGKLKLALKGGR